jgi:endonuclease/exonuclease/phosphatase family metal-dependent hydrolase
VRLATYNVRSLKQDRAAVVAVLRALAADVVALQEPPKWWFGRARLRRLAADAGLEVVVPGGLWGARTCAILAGPSAAGRVRDARAVRLRLHVRGRRHWFPTLRGAALATFGPAPDDALVLACVHLSLDPGERAAHLAVVERELGRSLARGGVGWSRVVVAGDLNEAPGGPAWAVLAAHGLVDAGADDPRPTFSPARPRRRIDALLVGAALRATAPAGTTARLDHPLAARASDHFAVVGELGALAAQRGHIRG